MTEDSPIGLLEAISIVRECEPDNLMSLTGNPRMVKFFDSLNECGTDALVNLGVDTGSAANSLVQISTVLQLLSFYHNDFSSLMNVMTLVPLDEFQKAIILAFKFGIGLAILEEMR